MTPDDDLKTLDASVLDLIHKGYSTANAILVRLAGDSRMRRNEFYRPLDRSLQRLRRAGKIEYDRFGWKMASQRNQTEREVLVASVEVIPEKRRKR